MSTITILGICYGVLGILFGLATVWAARRWPEIFRSEYTLKYHCEKLTYPGDPLSDEEIGWIFLCVFMWLLVVALVAIVLIAMGLWSVFTSIVRPPLNWLFRKIK
ncbi:MAG: hypothetical protein FJ044_05045 [Candidatus Cloacimonetes bacterium]|nr:hypothetical protein [Candidatus Cloacimonadota bacterium]